jgi:hypothetical protein
MRRARAPIDFRRGASSRLTTDAGTSRTIRLLGFVPAGGPFRLRPGDFVTRAPTIVPALGFASFRVAVDARICPRETHPRRPRSPRLFQLCAIAARARPRFPRHQPPTCGSPAGLSARGVTASFPVERSRPATGVSAARDAFALPAGTAFRPGEIACPSACCGADAWSFR